MLLRDNVVACFTGRGRGQVQVVATATNAAPFGANDPAVLARSEAVEVQEGGSCLALTLTTARFGPGTYYVWALAGERVAGRGGFRLLPAATPAPPSPPATTVLPSPAVPPLRPTATRTPVPTVAVTQRLHTGQRVQANTPGERLLVRYLPSKAASAPWGLEHGESAVIVDGPVYADNVQWWRVHSLARSDPDGWSSGEFLVPDGTLATPAPRAPSIAGDWVITDVVRYGVNAGRSFTFSVRISQNGDTVTGSGDLTFSGRISGRTLRVPFTERGGSGEFLWAISADGRQMTGTYASNSGNGGTSQGVRAAGGGTPQQLGLVAPISLAADGRFRDGAGYYVCFNLGRPARITLAGPEGLLANWDDDGTGQCLGPVQTRLGAGESERIVIYRLTVSENGRDIVTDTAAVLVTR